MSEYKYMCISNFYTIKDAFKEVNEMMVKGWVPVKEIPISSGYSSATIVILLKRKIKVSEVTIAELNDV